MGEVATFDPLDTEYLPKSTWLAPVKWNQGGYDALHMDEEGNVSIVQVTSSQSHSFKISYFKQVLENIKENFTIKTVEIYYVIPSEVHDFKITPVSGMGLLKEYPGWEEVDNEVTRVKILFSKELEMQPATSTKGKELTSLNVPSCW